MAVAFALGGSLCFNPLTDALVGADDSVVMLKAPEDCDLPSGGFVQMNWPTLESGVESEVRIAPDSERLQLLQPFNPNVLPTSDGCACLLKFAGNVLLIIFQWLGRGCVTGGTWTAFPTIC